MDFRKSKVTEARKIVKSIAEKQKIISKNNSDPLNPVLNEEIRIMESECARIQKDLKDSKQDLLKELRGSANDRMHRLSELKKIYHKFGDSCLNFETPKSVSIGDM